MACEPLYFFRPHLKNKINPFEDKWQSCLSLINTSYAVFNSQRRNRKLCPGNTHIVESDSEVNSHAIH